MAYARSQHASELMLPAEVVVLDKLPMLGSGKVDQLAMDKFVCDRMIRDSAHEPPHDLAAANPAAAE
jgi:acyl-[acyl-carrier-protein]-phospholipid O-acyltransferase / long-chain-fatty-acid--[acyl-carrier-protein] ligase